MLFPIWSSYYMSWPTTVGDWDAFLCYLVSPSSCEAPTGHICTVVGLNHAHSCLSHPPTYSPCLLPTHQRCAVLWSPDKVVSTPQKNYLSFFGTDC